MLKPFTHLKRVYIHPHTNYNKHRKSLIGVGVYLLILVLIYPSSSILFTLFLKFKEPAFISPVISNASNLMDKIHIRSDALGDGSFGAKRNGNRTHAGLDIKAKIGDTVRASKSGRVKTAYVPTGMGKLVRIDHAGGFSTIYGHLSKITVKNNQWVWQGAKIGEIGKTGNASYRAIAPHLHFEIRYKNKQLDPLGYLLPKIDVIIPDK